MKFWTVVLPLVLPTLVYLAWIWVEGRRRARSAAGEPLRWWMRVPWVWTLCAGVALMAVSLTALALFGGAEPGATYQPAVFEDGRVVPGRLNPPTPHDP